MLNVVMLSVIYAECCIKLIMLNVIMLSGIMLSVVMLNVMAPLDERYRCDKQSPPPILNYKIL
jgi:hypothetical protein